MFGRLQDVNIQYLGEEGQASLTNNNTLLVGSCSDPIHPTLGHRLSMEQPEVTITIPAKIPKPRANPKRKGTVAASARATRSPLQGACSRKRNATNPKGVSAKKRLCQDQVQSELDPAAETQGSQPPVNLILAAKKAKAKLRLSLVFVSYCIVPPVGLSGGLALFWKEDVVVEVLSSSQNFMDTKIKFQNISSYITFVYGAPNVENKQQIWNDISGLGAERETAWLLMGDFNEILDNSEKVGGPARAEGTFIPFRSFVFDRSLRDKEEIHTLVSDAWKSREEETLFSKFGRCRSHLIQWAKEQLEEKLVVIKVLQEALESELSSPNPNSEEISLLSEKLKIA
ncbi:unnamed protein product [Arabidopsis halleri]